MINALRHWGIPRKFRRRSGVAVQRVLGLVLMPVMLVLLGAEGFDQEKRLETQTTLSLRDGRRRVLIKRLRPAQEFQGLAFTRDGDIFMAYIDSASEASTFLSLFDMKRRVERELIEIGGTGNSEFAYDAASGVIAFSWPGGIYAVSLDKLVRLSSLNYPERLVRFREIAVPVVSDDSCSKPVYFQERQVCEGVPTVVEG